jgi:hypothetical protein
LIAILTELTCACLGLMSLTSTRQRPLPRRSAACTAGLRGRGEYRAGLLEKIARTDCGLAIGHVR